MTKLRHSEASILEALRSVEMGASVRVVCMEHGICEGTFYRWKTHFGDLEACDAQLTPLLQENRRLRSLVSELGRDNQALRRELVEQSARGRPGRPRSTAERATKSRSTPTVDRDFRHDAGASQHSAHPVAAGARSR